MQISERLEYFRTTQENIVIPTDELIKKKGSNIIVFYTSDGNQKTTKKSAIKIW